MGRSVLKNGNIGFHLAFELIPIDKEIKRTGLNLMEHLVEMKREDLKDDEIKSYMDYSQFSAIGLIFIILARFYFNFRNLFTRRRSQDRLNRTDFELEERLRGNRYYGRV